TIDVGGSLAAVTISGDALWVGDRDGTVRRLDVADMSLQHPPISTGRSIAAMAVVDGDVWLAAQASAADHRGGTLRIADPDLFGTDPLEFWSPAPLLGDGLVGYSRVGGSAGS